jgi:hypothetical protein
LRDIPQISKSGFLRVLRENDPFKAKWTILAKAYSLVRDDNLGRVGLDTFMSVCGPFIEIALPSNSREKFMALL